MATVTITLTDTPDGGPRGIRATAKCEPGIEIGADAEPLTPAQALAVRMLDAGNVGPTDGDLAAEPAKGGG